MNSCRSIEFAACTPPLITFISGTGSVEASGPPRYDAQRRVAGRAAFADGEGDAEDRVRAEAALVRGAVELDQRVVECCLVARVEPLHGSGELAVHVPDGPA